MSALLFIVLARIFTELDIKANNSRIGDEDYAANQIIKEMTKDKDDGTDND